MQAVFCCSDLRVTFALKCTRENTTPEFEGLGSLMIERTCIDAIANSNNNLQREEMIFSYPYYLVWSGGHPLFIHAMVESQLGKTIVLGDVFNGIHERWTRRPSMLQALMFQLNIYMLRVLLHLI